MDFLGNPMGLLRISMDSYGFIRDSYEFLQIPKDSQLFLIQIRTRKKTQKKPEKKPKKNRHPGVCVCVGGSRAP